MSENANLHVKTGSQENFITRIAKFYRRTQKIIIFFVLFPTIFTTAVGIIGIVLYDGMKDILFGILTISFAAAVLSGSIVAVVFTHKAAESAARQTAFLANISHELRSPLTAIKMFAQTLQDVRIDETNRKLCIDEIVKSTDRLDHLIQQIMQWRRIVSGKDFMTLEKTNANEAVSDATDNFLAVHPGSGDFLEVNLCEDSFEIYMDKMALSRALYNLLDNAWKYSEDSGRKIKISTRSVYNNFDIPEYFEYIVEDNGFGINQEDIEQIFDVFFRADYKLKGKAGVGLGLGIVKSIVIAHGGEIFVDSDVGKGSKFTLRIPLKSNRKAAESGNG